MATSEPSKVRRGAGEQDADLVPGARVGRYEILGRLGAGAMGTVYDAHDPALDRRIALKADSRPGRGHRRRRSPALAPRGESDGAPRPTPASSPSTTRGRDGDRLFIAMELVNGGTLPAMAQRSDPARGVRSWTSTSRAGEGLAASAHVGPRAPRLQARQRAHRRATAASASPTSASRARPVRRGAERAG